MAGLNVKGFWVKGSRIIEVQGASHINYIIDNPEDFGLDLEEIRNIYKKHGEKLGQEGDAREEIIINVSRRGWVRVRHYIRPRDYWSIQAYNERIGKKSIENFIYWALENKKMSLNDELQIFYYETEDLEIYDYKNGGVRKFLSEQIKKYKKNINRILEILKGKKFKHI